MPVKPEFHFSLTMECGHHIRALSIGGDYSWMNETAWCSACDQRKLVVRQEPISETEWKEYANV